MEIPNNANNLLSELKIDRDINRDEIIKIFYESMEANKITMRQFLENEKEFMRLLRRSHSKLSNRELKKILHSFSEIKELLIESNQVQRKNISQINSWYKRPSSLIDEALIIVLFVLLVILGFGFQHSNIYYSR